MSDAVTDIAICWRCCKPVERDEAVERNPPVGRGNYAIKVFHRACARLDGKYVRTRKKQFGAR